MEFKIGKLYKCSDHYILIYPTREKAASSGARPMAAGRSAAASRNSWAAAAVVGQAASYWSEELNCTVRCSEPNEIFIFLKEEIIEEQKYINVLFGDKQGWIVYKDWMKIERVF